MIRNKMRRVGDGVVESGVMRRGMTGESGVGMVCSHENPKDG